jgi:undecaprenyl-diphosphatase
MTAFEWLKLIIIGIVEGITEWLPVSSTAHMLLVDAVLPLSQSEEFKNMFFILIQLGAIMAVVVTFWKRLWPFGYGEQPGMAGKKCYVKKDIFMMWFKVVVACIPGFIVTMLFDDYVEAHLQTPYVIAIALAVYGLILILIEQYRKNKEARVTSVDDLSFKDAFIIGIFQCLSLIPGTSRSGSTIIGSLSIGINRTTAAEFTFFMAVPVMFGLSFIKILKFGFHFTAMEAVTLFAGCAIAFAVSLFVIRALLNYVKKHDYKVFGIYRIILGIVVILYFALVK